MRRRAVAIAVTAALVAGLGSLVPAATAAATAPLVIRTGPLTATVTLRPFSLAVTQNGESVVESAPGLFPFDPVGALSFAVGARAAAQPPLMGYGVIADVPLVWFHSTWAEPAPGGSLLVHTTDPTRNFIVRVRSLARGELAFDATLDETAGVLATSASFANDARQQFLGFGERSDRVNQTGQIVEQWNEEGPFSSGMFRPLTEPVLGKQWQGPPPFGPSSNFTMPWMVSSRGYGFLLDSTWLNRFDLTSSRAWRVETAEPALRWRLFAGPRPADVLRRATADPMIGRQPAPAEWFFGPWYQPRGSDAFRTTLMERFRTPISDGGYDVPVTVAQTYTHYLPCGAQAGGRATGAQAAQTSAYHSWGYRVTTYVNSFVCEAHPDGRYAEGEANGWFVKTAAGTTYPMPYLAYLDSPSAIVDFTAPGAAHWWESIIAEAIDDGYDGWMEDFGEYVPPDSVFADGRSGLAGHNDYCTLYHRASHELTWPARGSDFAQFVRCGYTGTGPVARIVWGGDPTEDDSEADGLAGAVSEGLSMGMSGIGYWGSDIGGFHALFTEGRTSPELLTRWLEFGAFSGIMRTEADGYPRPFLIDGARAQVWDPGVLPHWRLYSRLRTQLFPYVWAAAQEYQRTGMPMMRHLALAFPGEDAPWGLGDPAAADAARYEFLFGPSILVAPVVSEDAVGRDVWLPPGRWIPFWDAVAYDDETGEFTAAGSPPVLTGGRVIHVTAPLGEIPLFVKAGTCVPLLPPDVDTLDDSAGFAHDDEVVTLTEGIDRIRQLGFGTTCSALGG